MLNTSRTKSPRRTAETFVGHQANSGKLIRKFRCAIYTRKSSEEGLDMDFNSLDAQRESCEAYISSQKAEGCPVRQVPAAEIEKIVIDQIRALLRTPEIIVQTWRAAHKLRHDLTENDVRDAFVGFDELWAELFPAEQARIVELLVDRVDLYPDRLDITLKVEGLTSLCTELSTPPTMQQAAE